MRQLLEHIAYVASIESVLSSLSGFTFPLSFETPTIPFWLHIYTYTYNHIGTYTVPFISFSEGEYSPEITAIFLCFIFACSVALPYFVNFHLTLKKSLIWSTICMAISLCILGIYCHYQGSFGYASTEEYRHLPLICLGAFFMFFAVGPYRLSAECADQMIPRNYHFTVRCLLSSTSWMFIYGITRILPGLIDMIGVGWLFWYMAIMCILMAIFVSVFVPDLKKLPEELKLVESSESFSDA